MLVQVNGLHLSRRPHVFGEIEGRNPMTRCDIENAQPRTEIQVAE